MIRLNLCAKQRGDTFLRMESVTPVRVHCSHVDHFLDKGMSDHGYRVCFWNAKSKGLRCV